MNLFLHFLFHVRRITKPLVFVRIRGSEHPGPAQIGLLKALDRDDAALAGDLSGKNLEHMGRRLAVAVVGVFGERTEAASNAHDLNASPLLDVTVPRPDVEHGRIAMSGMKNNRLVLPESVRLDYASVIPFMVEVEVDLAEIHKPYLLVAHGY